MLYRRGFTWPMGDDAEETIGVSWVFDHAHGDEYDGHDDDGAVHNATIVNPSLANELKALEANGLLRWPSPQRAELEDRVFATAEAEHAALGTFAGTALTAFEPTPNLPSMHDVDPNYRTADGTRQDNSAVPEGEAPHPLRDRAMALLLSKQAAAG